MSSVTSSRASTPSRRRRQTALLVALSVMSSVSAQTPIHLQADYELKDGRVADAAAPTVVPELDASATRVWIGQGQVLAAINLATQQRVHAEDKTYDGTIVAVEADAANKYLFTAEAIQATATSPGKATIHWDGLPPAPYPVTLSAELDLVEPLDLDPSGSPTCTVGSASFAESIQDMKFWAPASKLVVITDRRLIVINCAVTVVQGPGGLLSLQYTMEIAEDSSNQQLKQCLPAMAHSNAFGQSNQFRALESLHLGVVGGNVVAFCTALILVNGLPAGTPTKGYRGIVACNLNNLQSQPSFLNSATTQHPQYWDPFSATTSPDPFNSVTRIDGLFDATLSKYFVYASCGPASSLAGIDVSALLGSGPGSGMPPPTLGVWPSLTLTNPDLSIPQLTNVRVDPLDPQKLYASSFSFTNPTRLFRVNRLTGAFDQLASAFHQGPVADMVFVRRDPVGGPRLDTLWTCSQGTVDYVRRVFDISGPQGSGPLSLEPPGNHPGIYGCDGAVAIPEFANSIYLPTFGGVLRCQLQRLGQPPVLIDSSYSVAGGVIAGSGTPGTPSGQKNTEHLQIGRVGQSRYLFASDGTGGFTSWLVDPTSHDPSANPVYVPAAQPTMGHDGLGPIPGPAYANDVAFYFKPDGVGGFRYFVLVDSMVNGTIYLQQFEVTGGITPAALPASALFHENDPDVVGNPQCIAVTDGAAIPYAFVGAKKGFMAVNLNTGAVTAYKPQANWIDYQQVQGIAIYGRTLFLSLTSTTSPFGGAVAMFDFDPATGVVGVPSGNAKHVLNGGTGSPLPPGFTQVAVKDINDSTFVFGGGGRCRRSMPVLSGSVLAGHLYTCASGGHMLDFQYTIDATTFLPQTLSFVGRWNNPAYHGEMQDCRIYYFGPPSGSPPGTPDIGDRVLTVKNEQCFALVIPQ